MLLRGRVDVHKKEQILNGVAAKLHRVLSFFCFSIIFFPSSATPVQFDTWDKRERKQKQTKVAISGLIMRSDVTRGLLPL